MRRNISARTEVFSFEPVSLSRAGVAPHGQRKRISVVEASVVKQGKVLVGAFHARNCNAPSMVYAVPVRRSLSDAVITCVGEADRLCGVPYKATTRLLAFSLSAM